MARADALAANQEAVIGQQIAEQLPQIVGEAAKAFGNIGQMTVLLGMGAAAIPLLRGVIDQNGHGAAENGAKTQKATAAKD